MSRIPADIRAFALILAVALLSAFGVSLATASSRPIVAGSPPGPRVVPPTATPLPGFVAGPLDGLRTARRLALRRPIAVLIDNFAPDARPQSGLDRASVVFEAPVEGGVTRLMAIYAEKDAEDVGPIRSARPYFVTWAEPFHALFVHAGGSPGSLRQLYSTPQLANIEAERPLPEFKRTTDRVDPHNLYSSTTGIRAVAQRSGWDKSVAYRWLSHQTPSASGATGTVNQIHVDFGTAAIAPIAGYSVDWQYDRTRNVYTRSVGGTTAIDRAENRPIEATNVIVLYARIHPIANDAEGRLSVTAVGSGRALVFRDGSVVHATWSKKVRLSPIELTDPAGRSVSIDPGTTWIEVTTPNSARFSKK